VGFYVTISKLKLLKEERRSAGGHAGELAEDPLLLARAASHRLHGTVLVRRSSKKIVRAKSKLCPEEPKKSESEEFASRISFELEDGPAPDFNPSMFTSSYSCTFRRVGSGLTVASVTVSVCQYVCVSDLEKKNDLSYQHQIW